ncbi:sensor histidine kinase [Sanyastnella coralliicola]|uniref:sensor histidine kinase n=1 Tax=Sanyastnella coralliicola TaxID=3069118 RepID=UPI0027B9CB22|nr:7TM diverse intracellular signaling domain-containing protein [Longitalea sp. SCSIO 12813]
MRSLLVICFFVFCTQILLSQSEKEALGVSISIIDNTTNGEKLDQLDYTFNQNEVATLDNGTHVAVKLEVREDAISSENSIHLDYALLDTVELWKADVNGQLELVCQTGQAFAFDTRPYENSSFVFPLDGTSEEYYLRVFSTKPVVLPFKLLEKGELVRELTFKDFLFGIYGGAMMVMFLYNLVLTFITRDNSYGFYIIFLVCILTAQYALFGYTDRYLLADWPALNQKFTVLTGAVVGIATVIFVTNFLQLKLKAPKFLIPLYGTVLLDFVAITQLIFDLDVAAYHTANVASLYGSCIVIAAALKLSRNGFKPAKFLLIAWSILIVTVAIFAMTNLGVIPYKPYFLGAILFGSSIEVVLLSIALADRINALRKETEESQEKALEMARENERIIREQNVILEEKVQSRTEELQGANNELKNTLENLKETQTQLVQSEKMASLGVLTAGVAHEINNPLNFIHGGSAAINAELENEEVNKEELREYLRWINVGVEKASQIVKSLNIYSRTNDDFTEECDLHEIIDGCLSILQYKTKDQISLEKEFSSDLGVVKGNSGKLHQVVLNLIGNAIDSIEEDGVVKISTETKNDKAVIRIVDTGAGIAKEDLEKILDPFFTTKAPGEGTGLGLSIVNSIVQEHGGTIDFESELGKGTTVTLSIPML